jgi:hypothetical protein
MEDIDIAYYIDAVHKNIKNPTKESSLFINNYMPKFLQQMMIFYQTDIEKFNNIYNELQQKGPSEVLNILEYIKIQGIPYEGGKPFKSKKHIKKNRRISKKMRKD